VTPIPVFSPLGPLPEGRVAIEASAGTGKTYTLAGLVVRYVAEAGVAVEKILVVTFTRAAAAELRDRVRSRLTEAVIALRDPAGTEVGDDLLALVASADRERRLSRLEKAVVDFDAATITTIHGFAQQVLRTLGSAAAGDLDATLFDNTPELLRSVCADVLAAESFAETTIENPLPSAQELSGIAAKVLANPGIVLVPDIDESGANPAATRLRRLVDSTVEGVHRRRRAAGTLSFDDLLTQLRDALENEAAASILRRRFQIALIDEFQDTDPVQWAIFERLFGIPGDNTTLVLVADPKQAIYAFRGANVHTYLEAAYQKGTQRSTLGTNWRSDGALLAALERLLSGATFGDPRIEFAPVKASEQNRDLRLSTADGGTLPALAVRLALGEDLPRIPAGPIQAGAVEAAIARDLALEVQALLDTARLPARGDEPARRLRPNDIAVLVGQHTESEIVQTALRRRGIPAVTTRADSVLRSPAATQWQWLLNALARPSDPTRARSAALSWFFGWTVAALAEADSAALSEIQTQLDSWAKTLAARGTVALCARIWSETGVSARVLAASDGDRNITDLDHIASLLQAASAGRRPSPTGLLSLLDELDDEVPDDPENAVTARQVESDAEAVQIMTVFVAKGLEFPVVCVPTMWRSGHATAHEVVYQDPATGQRTFDIATKLGWPTVAEAAAHKTLADAEAVGESLRLLYVALTRAEHQTLLWWTRSSKSELTGLARLLFGRTAGEIDAELFSADRVVLPSDLEAAAGLEVAFAATGDAVAVTVTGAAAHRPGRWMNTAARPPESGLELAALHRVPDRADRRWSFSAMTARAEDSEPDSPDESLGDSGASDEPFEEPEVAENVSSGSAAATSDLPLGAIAGGVQFGTLVHEVLEDVDFAAAELDSELLTSIEDRLRWNPWPVDPGVLAFGLRAVIESPLGPLFGGLRLRDLPRGERMNELSFDLHLAGRGRRPTDRDIGALVLGHMAHDDPLRSWAERLSLGLLSVELAGHLTGSIDMVVRVPGGGDARPAPRFVVIDYKTNVLAAPARLPQELDYHPDRLPGAMAEHHYPLQALLYSVALHRYLRWRVPGYEPSLHLGGIAYLFVRGMAGATTPVVGGDPYGVFSWRVPAELVGALSDLLDGTEASS
jgi:exodeoxyribonuclease V beta subunit